MKNARKLTREQKALVAHQGLDPAEWLLQRELPQHLLLRRKGTEELKVIERG